MNTTINNKTKFEDIYVTHYSRMKSFAKEYVVCEEDSENIVQDVFLNLWEQNSLLQSHTNLFAYLFTSVRNKCIDFLRHKTIVLNTAQKLQEDYRRTLQLKLQSLEDFDEHLFSEIDIETNIQNAIESLPAKCREIFILSKFEGLKQKQIAQQLNLSINTVESQMTIAYKKLKEVLKEHVLLLIFFTVYFFHI